MTIELYLQPGSEPAGRLGSILSLYDAERPENLIISRLGSKLLVRLPVWDAVTVRKSREVTINAGLRPGIRRFVVVTAGATGTMVYVDGVLSGTYPQLTLRPEPFRGRLILGNVPQGHPSWEGRLLGFALFNRRLAPSEVSRHNELWMGDGAQALASEAGPLALYLFNERSGRGIQDHSPSRIPLVIPVFYHALEKAVLVPPWKDSRSIRDLAINLVGFIPFGFFYFMYRMKKNTGPVLRNAAIPVILSGLISAAIELLQVYLPTRASQLADIMCNVSGSFVGVIFAIAFSFIQSRAPRCKSA